MFNMKRSLLAGLVLLACTFNAFATDKTCEYGGKWPNCNPKPEEPAPVDPSQSQNQEQNQDASANAGAVGVGLGVGYGQGGEGGSATATGGEGGRGGNAGANAGVAGSGNSTNSLGAVSGSNATGGSIRDAGNSESTSGASSGSSSGALSGSQSGAFSGGNSLSNGSASDSFSGGNSQDTATSVNVDASDRSSNSYTSQSLWLPQVETAAPAVVASPVVTIVPGVCGPRVKRISEQVSGTYVGIIKKSSIPLGTDDVAVEMEAEPFRYHQGRNGTLVEGSRVSYAVFAVGVAASRSIGVGGGETGGNWGQGGASSGSSIQRPIVRALITPCLMEVAEPDQPAANDDYFEPQVNG